MDSGFLFISIIFLLYILLIFFPKNNSMSLFGYNQDNNKKKINNIKKQLKFFIGDEENYEYEVNFYFRNQHDINKVLKMVYREGLVVEEGGKNKEGCLIKEPLRSKCKKIDDNFLYVPVKYIKKVKIYSRFESNLEDFINFEQFCKIQNKYKKLK